MRRVAIFQRPPPASASAAPAPGQIESSSRIYYYHTLATCARNAIFLPQEAHNKGARQHVQNAVQKLSKMLAHTLSRCSRYKLVSLLQPIILGMERETGLYLKWAYPIASVCVAEIFCRSLEKSGECLARTRTLSRSSFSFVPWPRLSLYLFSLGGGLPRPY